MSNCFIRGLGLYAPDNILTNADLEKMVDTSDEWIITRTGITERRIVSPGQTCTDLAAEATRRALAKAGMRAEDLTHVFLATLTPDTAVPPAATTLAHKLGVRGVLAMDMDGACSGFLYTLEVARAFVTLHPEANVLVAASEILSSRTNWSDRSTCVLFGDGAGVVVVSSSGPGMEVIDLMLSSDGQYGPLLTVAGGYSGHPYKAGDTIDDDYFIKMNGREVFKHAVRNMSEISMDLLQKHGLKPSDVDVLLPHQANLRILDAVGRKLGIPPEKVFSNVQRYGNTSAASVPIALVEAVETGFIKPGDLVLITTFGGGLTWGSALVRA